MAWKKFGKKVAKKVGRAIRKRYYGKGKLNVRRIAKDVAMVKSLINVEKKRNEWANAVGSPTWVGQVNGNASGAQIVDITPIVTQGTSNNQRTGNVIKMTSFYHRFQVLQQGNNTKQGKVIIEYWLVKGQNVPATSATLEKLFNDNVFMPSAPYYIDYNCSRNPDYFADFIPLAKKVVYMKADNTSADVVTSTFAISRKKFNHHIRYDPGTGNVISGQIIMTLRADCGNRSSATAYTDTGYIPESAINSGYGVQINFTNYYVDN